MCVGTWVVGAWVEEPTQRQWEWGMGTDPHSERLRLNDKLSTLSRLSSSRPSPLVSRRLPQP